MTDFVLLYPLLESDSPKLLPSFHGESVEQFVEEAREGEPYCWLNSPASPVHYLAVVRNGNSRLLVSISRNDLTHPLPALSVSDRERLEVILRRSARKPQTVTRSIGVTLSWGKTAMANMIFYSDGAPNVPPQYEAAMPAYIEMFITQINNVFHQIIDAPLMEM